MRMGEGDEVPGLIDLIDARSGSKDVSWMMHPQATASAAASPKLSYLEVERKIPPGPHSSSVLVFPLSLSIPESPFFPLFHLLISPATCKNPRFFSHPHATKVLDWPLMRQFCAGAYLKMPLKGPFFHLPDKLSRTVLHLHQDALLKRFLAFWL